MLLEGKAPFPNALFTAKRSAVEDDEIVHTRALESVLNGALRREARYRRRKRAIAQRRLMRAASPSNRARSMASARASSHSALA